jgi:hypothetical protein
MIQLKGRDFLLWFFHQTSSPSPVTPRKDFESFPNIRGIIHIWKRLPGGFTTGSPVYSSPGSWDSPVNSPQGSRPRLVCKRTCYCQIHQVVETPLGSLDSWSIIHQKVSFCKPVLMLVQSTIRSRLPGAFTTGKSRLKIPQCIHQRGVVLDTGESFYRFSGAYNNL